jgi:hypothetical protein
MLGPYFKVDTGNHRPKIRASSQYSVIISNPGDFLGKIREKFTIFQVNL